MEIISNFGILHEDVMIYIFLITLEDEVVNWFIDFGKWEISSFASFIELFYKQCDSSNEDNINVEGTQASISSSLEDKGLESHLPLRNFGFMKQILMI